MIPEFSIREWNAKVPWTDMAQVEQDLIICRALVDIFSDDFLASQLAFRGGTALHKLYLHPQPRYSEDIDLVQITPGPIKPIMFRLGEVLSWLPDRVTKQKRYNNTMLFRLQSEIAPVQPLRIKLEINCFEHFNVMGLAKIPFEVRNSWFNGEADLTTYHLEELLGTKLRALHQRKKGRDLFDLYMALQQGGFDKDKVIECYNTYMDFVVDKKPTYKQFVNNMETKMQDKEFLTDTLPLLRPEIRFNQHEAYKMVYDTFIDCMPGKRD